jgi:hypothetical protein
MGCNTSKIVEGDTREGGAAEQRIVPETIENNYGYGKLKKWIGDRRSAIEETQMAKEV